MKSFSFLTLSTLSQVFLAVSILAQQPNCQFKESSDQKHSFALASIDNDMQDDLVVDDLYRRAAEACYQECNSAEIMSLSSSYWKQKMPLTVLDRESNFLIDHGFFQMNETYLVNHIAAADEDDTDGLGCIGLESDSQIMFYPLETGSCRNTEYVVCGLPSKAHGSNPVGVTDNKPTTNNAHPDQAVMNSGNNGKDTTTDTTNHMDQINNNNHPSIPSGYVASPGAQATNVPQAAHNDATTGRTPNDNQNENDLVFSLKIADMNYRVIRLQETHLTLESATSFCTSHRDNLGSLYATSLPTFSSWMQRVHPTETIIIGSWNGDSYGAGQSQCLLYSTTGGIHLGSCSDASILLCESDFENDTPQYKST